MYSFHFGGVHCVLGDGVVRCISQPIDIDTMASLITSKGHELIPLEDFTCPNEFGSGLDQNWSLRSAGWKSRLIPKRDQLHATRFD